MPTLPAAPSFNVLQASIDALPDPIFVKDLDHRWIAGNEAFYALMGKPADALLGQDDRAYFPADQVEVFWRIDDEVTTTGQAGTSEELFTRSDGEVRTIWTRKFPLRNEFGRIIGLIGVITDITDLKRRQVEVGRLEAELAEKAQIIRAQTTLLDEIAVPVIQVWDNVLLLPLVGGIDSRRAARVMDSVLQSINQLKARMVLIDVTGVPIVDTGIAGNLIRTMQAAQLLGCECIIVGISPQIAHTLVTLGIDFGHITTHASLQSGLQYALKRLNYLR